MANKVAIEATNPTLVNFGEALVAIKKGKKAFRQAWDCKGNHTTIEYLPETEETLEDIRANLWFGKKVNGWVPTSIDLLAEDWIIED